MTLKKPRCNFCDRTLQTVQVDGSAIGESELTDVIFDVQITKAGVSAKATTLTEDTFLRTSNPIRFIALVESWVEDTAEKVKCPLCKKAVAIERVQKKEPINIPQSQQMGLSTNPAAAHLQQLLQQMGGQAPGGANFFGGSQPTITPVSPQYGQNRATIMAMLDSKLTDAELTDLLTDVGINMLPSATRAELLAELEMFLYD